MSAFLNLLINTKSLNKIIKQLIITIYTKLIIPPDTYVIFMYIKAFPMHKGTLIYADNMIIIIIIIYPHSELITKDSINCKLPKANEVIYDIRNNLKKDGSYYRYILIQHL